jgi:hypothetical protein
MKTETNSTELVSYGSISKDFKIMASLTILLNKIKNKEIEQTRVDCYGLGNIPMKVLDSINTKFENKNLNLPNQIEIFYPSQKYPSHTDDGGTSYFIALENGEFLIGDVSYPIVPFVLYSFDDSMEHNTNFAAIMLK